MKKNYLLIFILTLLLTLTISSNAMAATGISAAEQLILDKMKEGADINGDKKYLSSAYVNQAENEFLRNKVDLTKEQAEFIIAKIDEAIAVISEVGAVDIANIQNSEVAFQLLSLVGEVANEVNYEVSVDIANRSINVTNPEGDTVFIAKNTVNETGNTSGDAVWMIILILSILSISCVPLLLFHIINRRNEQRLRWNGHNKAQSGAFYEE